MRQNDPLPQVTSRWEGRPESCVAAADESVKTDTAIPRSRSGQSPWGGLQGHQVAKEGTNEVEELLEEVEEGI